MKLQESACSVFELTQTHTASCLPRDAKEETDLEATQQGRTALTWEPWARGQELSRTLAKLGYLILGILMINDFVPLMEWLLTL